MMSLVSQAPPTVPLILTSADLSATLGTFNNLAIKETRIEYLSVCCVVSVESYNNLSGALA